MQIQSKDCMEIEHHLFCILNLFSFNIYPNVGREGAQTKFGIVDLLCLICGGGFECLCGSSPHTYSCTCFYLTEKQKWKQTRALPAELLESLNFIFYYYY